MTTPTNVASAKIAELPAPQFPMLTRMVSKPLFDDREAPVTWAVGQAHPLASNMNVVRMFVSDIGVEIYSASQDGKIGTRNRIPHHMVRFVEEAMPLDVFAEELTAAELDGYDDNDELDLDEPAQLNGSTGDPITS